MGLQIPTWRVLPRRSEKAGMRQKSGDQKQNLTGTGQKRASECWRETEDNKGEAVQEFISKWGKHQPQRLHPNPKRVLRSQAWALQTKATLIGKTQHTGWKRKPTPGHQGSAGAEHTLPDGSLWAPGLQAPLQALYALGTGHLLQPCSTSRKKDNDVAGRTNNLWYN